MPRSPGCRCLSTERRSPAGYDAKHGGPLAGEFGTTHPNGPVAVVTQGFLESFTGATDGCVTVEQRREFDHAVSLGWIEPLSDDVRIVVKVEGETHTFGPFPLDPEAAMCPRPANATEPPSNRRSD